MEQDLVKAVNLYRCAGDQSNIPAKHKLGCHYFNSAGQNHSDLAIAVQYWKDAANSGHQVAQFRLAKCLEDGIGISQDIREARMWYAKSAVKGHYGAKWALRRLNEQNV